MTVGKTFFAILALVVIAGAIWYALEGAGTGAPAANQPVAHEACQTSSDCPAGESCLTSGPLVAGQPAQKHCYAPGQMVPL